MGVFVLLFCFLLPITMANQKDLQAVVQGNAQFTKNLYNALSKKPGNVFFSPISAHAVLSMAYQGSAGTTQQAFATSLQVPSIESAAAGYKEVMDHLSSVPNVTLLIANKIFLMANHALKANFKEVVTKQFHSEVDSIDFADSVKAANTINSWVQQKTQNKIDGIVKSDSLDGTTRLVLVNAIYFKGNWADKFSPEKTKSEPFYLSEKNPIDVQMMNKKAKYLFKYDEGLDAKILEMPYSNRDVSLVIVLPNKIDGINDLEKKLQDTDLSKITQDMSLIDVFVKLPKFKIETTIDLTQPLTDIGLGNIFSSSANFSNIIESNEPLYVSQAIQKAYIEVNEEGTEAAAATGITLMYMSLPLTPPPRFEFYADHPFQLYLVKRVKATEEATLPGSHDKTILFSGRILNPNEN